MSIWNLFFSRSVKTGDAFFGEMRFIEHADPAKSYFECQRYFEPSGKLIELSVAGTLSGPTQRQKDFFAWVEHAWVEHEYTALATKLTPLLEQEFGAWMPQPVINDFYAEFKPTFLDLPACDQHPVAWEIGFDTIHDVNHIVTVGMLGNEPQYVRVDG